MKRLPISAALLGLIASTASNAEIAFTGYVEGSAAISSSGPSWLDGGGSVLGNGDGALLESRFGWDFAPTDSRWFASLSLLARADSNANAGRRVGLLEGFIDYGALDDDGFRVRVGQAFAGSSRENIEQFWQTPFTLSLSALNSWIGEEFRPIGVDFTHRWAASDGGAVDVSATLYGGNDTGPAVLAWRGFALHNRLTVYGEALPLLPLASLRAANQFGEQRSDGSQPFGPDLDGRAGFAVRARYDNGSGLRLSALVTDNRGDRDLHDGDEYAWSTRFGVAGFDWALTPEWTLLGELLHGRTLMGFPPGANVDFGFDAAYLLLSRRFAQWTISGRVEAFHISERDRSIAELNTQNGQALTLAVLREHGDWRFGVEATYADINRPGNLEFSNTTEQGGTQLLLSARRYF